MKAENSVLSLRLCDSPPPLFFSESDEKERAPAFDKAQGQHAEFNRTLKKVTLQSAALIRFSVFLQLFQGEI